MLAIVTVRLILSAWAALAAPTFQPSSKPADTSPSATPAAAEPSAPAKAPKSPQAAPDLGHSKPAPAIAYPHPLITEVLFAVPTGNDGDANKDGKREVSGDEFIEIVNPHDRSIDLRGYMLTDGSAVAKTTLKFTFPEMTVPPHGVVVVFNGHDSKIPGPVGDAKHAPASVNDQFSKAAVFTMRVTSSRVSFSNAGDAACLRAPDGKLLQRVRWGKADEKAGGAGFVLDEIAPVSTKGSVQRDGIGKDGAWKAHTEIDSTPFSPGVFAGGSTSGPAPASAPASGETGSRPASPEPSKGPASGK